MQNKIIFSGKKKLYIFTFFQKKSFNFCLRHLTGPMILYVTYQVVLFNRPGDTYYEGAQTNLSS